VGWSPRNFATWSEVCSIYKCWSKIWGFAPQKTFGGKNTLNLAHFRTSSHFEREYLRNRQRYPKSENLVHDSISSRFQWKKFGELWSTNHGDLEVELYPKNWLLEYHILAHRGCDALKFLHAPQTDQGLLAHTPEGMGVPSTIFLQRRVKNWYTM